MTRFIACAAVVGVVALAGCGSGDLTLDQADPDAVPEKPSWDLVYPIFQRECIPCHTGDERRDNGAETRDQDTLEGAAPRRVAAGGAEPGLESCRAIIDNLDGIYKDIFVDNDMPPGAWPRLTSEEKLIIERWLDSGAFAPCN